MEKMTNLIGILNLKAKWPKKKKFRDKNDNLCKLKGCYFGC